ncbi:MAG TPA: hypothetical protein VKJ47_15830 [Candidatus Binatia bacterium]|nr:hypothetical protein [Candidatus Binatia bacterium]
MFAAIRLDSVPVRLIGQQVPVLLHTNDLVIFDGRQSGRSTRPAHRPADSKPTSNSTTTSRH